MAIALITVRALRDQLADRLRSDLLSSRFTAGQRLGQDEIAARYGVSRTPAREAILQLRNEGLLEVAPKGGVRVAAQTDDATRWFLNGLRHTIEEHALRICLDELTDDDYTALERIVKKMKAACKRHDDQALAEHDIAFHRYLVERSNQPTLVTIWSLIVGGIRSSFQSAYAAFEDRMDIHREHQEILKRFRAGDKEAAIAFYASRIGIIPQRNANRRK